MKVNIARFYNRERWKLDCEIITPMFLGNASQEAELRAAPFKGILRYWWRVANGAEYPTPESLLAAENRIFGSADEKSGGRSRVIIRVKPVSNIEPADKNFTNPGDVDHPECEKTHNKVNPLNYLAGMGLIHFRKGIQHTYFPAGGRFRLHVEAAGDVAEEVEAALGFFSSFGAIGSRSRNGWGSLVTAGANPARPALVDWEDAMKRDYPHCLGKDDKGALLWKTRTPRMDWELCMRDLAEAYIALRAGSKRYNIPKLDVIHGDPPDRHLLGYPVTNHKVGKPNWGNQGRHGSALRLLVRKEEGGHRGYILHLPHLFSQRMWSGDKQRQIAVWKKVHQALDGLCERVTTGEVKS